MRTIIASCVLVVFSFGVIVADEFVGQITKVETKDGKTTISGTKKGKKKTDEAKEFSFTVAKDVKVNKAGKFDKDTKKFEVGDAIEGGIKSDIFKEITPEKPLAAFLTTDEKDMVTSILVTKAKKKKE
jgi:hypothetical protein